MTAPVDRDLGSLTDDELTEEILRLQIEIAIRRAQIEPPSAKRKRSLRLARGTLLTGLGFFGLTLDPISGIIAIVGFFDWMEAVREDAAVLNQQIRLRSDWLKLNARLEKVTAEVRRRGGISLN
ncbi:MAG: hypothetical protein WAU53_06875 [Rhodoplanes sp.]